MAELGVEGVAVGQELATAALIALPAEKTLRNLRALRSQSMPSCARSRVPSRRSSLVSAMIWFTPRFSSKSSAEPSPSLGRTRRAARRRARRAWRAGCRRPRVRSGRAPAVDGSGRPSLIDFAQLKPDVVKRQPVVGVGKPDVAGPQPQAEARQAQPPEGEVGAYAAAHQGQAVEVRDVEAGGDGVATIAVGIFGLVFGFDDRGDGRIGCGQDRSQTGGGFLVVFVFSVVFVVVFVLAVFVAVVVFVLVFVLVFVVFVLVFVFVGRRRLRLDRCWLGRDGTSVGKRGGG